MSTSPIVSRSGSSVINNVIDPSATSSAGAAVTNAKVTSTVSIVLDKLSATAHGILVQPFLTGTASVKQNLPFPTITNSTAATTAQTPPPPVASNTSTSPTAQLLPPPVASNTTSSTGPAWHEKLMETAHSTVVQPFLSSTAYIKQQVVANSATKDVNNTAVATGSSAPASGNEEILPSDKVLSAYTRALNANTKALKENTAIHQQSLINTMPFSGNQYACVASYGRGHGHHSNGTNSTNSSHGSLPDLEQGLNSGRTRKGSVDKTFSDPRNSNVIVKEGELQVLNPNLGTNKVAISPLSTGSSDGSGSDSIPHAGPLNTALNSTNTVPGHLTTAKAPTPPLSKSPSKENLHKPDHTLSGVVHNAVHVIENALHHPNTASAVVHK